MKTDKITCGICGKKFRPEDMTGKTRGIWFVICCEKCKREEQAIGKVVWEPEIKKLAKNPAKMAGRRNK